MATRWRQNVLLESLPLLLLLLYAQTVIIIIIIIIIIIVMINLFPFKNFTMLL